MGPLHQIKGDLNLFFLKLSLHGFALYLHRIHSGIVPITCVNLKQIHAGKALKKINLNLLLFDVGGPHDIIMADNTCHGNGRHPGEFQTLAHFSQYLPNSYIKSEARTEFSSLFYIYSKISSFQTALLHGLHL